MDENTQAILLLSTYFSPPKKGDQTPLTPTEYGRFAHWLRENQFKPKDLFHRFDELQQMWVDPKKKITVERLQFLLGRGMAMGVALEKWQSAGIWVITRSDPDYPARLKKHLNKSAPAVLFGVGNKQLLNTGGLSMVGSRNIDVSDQQYTKMVAQQAAMNGLNVVSGGARGVDETAMLASLEVDGTALGILANDLLKTALSGKWRQYIKRNQVALISTYYPEASFKPGNAMGRNKYIYCLSDYALVVRSDEGKGGTWSGANENLKKEWVPLFVRAHSDAEGNRVLVELGASPLSTPDEDQNEAQDWLLKQLMKSNKSEYDTTIVESDALTEGKSGNSEDLTEVQKHVVVKNETETKVVDEPMPVTLLDQSTITDGEPSETNYDEPDLFYRFFVGYVKHLLKKQSQITLAMLKGSRGDLTQKQITDWLDRATDEGLIERHGKKRTYTMKNKDSHQQDIFSMMDS